MTPKQPDFLRSNELLLAVFIGLVILLFVHVTRRNNQTREENVDLTSVEYLRVFLIAVTGAYVFLYMLGSFSSATKPASMSGGGADGPSILVNLDEAVEAALKQIDVGDPGF